ncbi:endonuclease/exonuclease/phosphatase family protein [Medicago truncatula]|uniref:Endonuclease/exonuclease/phosphatase family protein n=1 Tax=Medicago truncatula TaxID=3880 RepID=A0A072UGY0_MEDTR|nr:endonuclease/exonuclease/phosphatase family protein [Medicago truncatula]
MLVNYSNNHITVEFFDSVHGTWRLTGYYGYPNGERRRAAWEFLRQLSNQYADPWCIFGDFNDIMDDSEKRGRTSRPWWLINGFRQVVLDFGLTDVPFEGYPFTWFKSLGTPRTVEERLDRALANNSNLENLVAPTSDHYSILLNRNPVPRPHLRHRNFRYENAWHIEPGFREVVTNVWNMTDHTSIIPKLSASAEDMSSWSKDHCRKLKNNIVECHREMQNIRLNSSENSQSQLLEVRKRMNRPLAQDDAYWRQRAKAYWFRDGDRNTKFFHAAATARKKVNRLLSLEDNAGNKVSNDQGMRDLAKNYFLELFQQHNNAAAPVIDVIQQSVSANDNMSLTAPFTKEEFQDAMFSMHPDKCPGLDGYSPGFYQHFWSLCSDDIYKECCAWLDTGQFPPDLNMKNIAIIPKGNSLYSMKDCRPIALCNVLYKEEERDHLFFQCDYYGRLWLMLSDWLGFVTVLNGNLYSHANQFCALGGTGFFLLKRLILDKSGSANVSIGGCCDNREVEIKG